MLDTKNRKILTEISDDEKVEMRKKMAFADQTDRKNLFSPTCTRRKKG
jgi:ACS family allantoate permease-like MFS transporter